MCDQRVQKKKTKTVKRKHKRVLCLRSETARKFDFFTVKLTLAPRRLKSMIFTVTLVLEIGSQLRPQKQILSTLKTTKKKEGDHAHRNERNLNAPTFEERTKVSPQHLQDCVRSLWSVPEHDAHVLQTANKNWTVLHSCSGKRD